MVSAALRKSITDLTRRRARALFTVLTLALAVASVGLLAVSPLMERAMLREVEANRLPDVTVSMAPLELEPGDLEALRALPNVAAVEPRAMFPTRVWDGGRRERAVVIGVPDFAHQSADVVHIEQGVAPDAGGALTDANNARQKGFDPPVGSAAGVIGADGRTRELPITGTARNLTGGEDDPANDWVALYVSMDTIADLSGATGFTTLGLRLEHSAAPAVDAAVAAVRDELRARTAFTAFEDLPVVNEPGTYPGKESFENLAGLLNVVTLLALLSALVLLSNTMTTLVSEQTAEIAAMKAIGARRRDVRRIYLRTALLFGVIGGVLGAALGVLIANAVVGSFASMFFGVDASFGVSVPVVVACMVVGLIGPPLAALPAVRRAARLPLGEALRASGSAVGGQGRLDALLRRARGLPRPVQIGLRSVGRRKRRAAATAALIALAVGTSLAFLSVGSGVAETTRGWFDDNRFDIWIQAAAGRTFDEGSGRSIGAVEGVAGAQPWVSNDVKVRDRDAEAWGLPARPLMDVRVEDGRFYSPGEVATAARVAVVGRTLAERTQTKVGDDLPMTTANGPATFRVIGISRNQAANGEVVFLPDRTLQQTLDAPVNNYWITTTSDDHGLIDATTTRLEDVLAASGNQVVSMVNYDAREEQLAANASISMSITVLGLLIVAISMVALINTITTGVLERTREIGVLRSIGARARDVRRIFATEGLVVALVGWSVGVPLGYGLARAVGWLAGNAVGLDIAFVFPLIHVAGALVGTLALAVLVMLLPLRRAVRFQPGEALRHV